MSVKTVIYHKNGFCVLKIVLLDKYRHSQVNYSCIFSVCNCNICESKVHTLPWNFLTLQFVIFFTGVICFIALGPEHLKYVKSVPETLTAFNER